MIDLEISSTSPSRRVRAPSRARCLPAAIGVAGLLLAAPVRAQETPAPSDVAQAPAAPGPEAAQPPPPVPEHEVATTPSSGTLPVAGKPVAPGLRRRHQGAELVWDPAFNRMDLPEIVVASVAGGVALAANIAPPLKTGWLGINGFDDGVRNVLRLSSYQARLDARDASDVGLALITTFPILVDSLIVAYWYRGSQDVAFQMGLIDIEAMTIAGAIEGSVNFLSGRERPYGPGCGTEISSNTIDCQSSTRYRSFFSGHSTLSFTSASLICAHHMRLHLFESAADPVACITAYFAAATVATLRVVGDVHYATDVLTGAAVGTTVGLVVPLVHHYSREPSPRSPGAGLEVHLVPSLTGGSVVGTF